jgi:hypothetical protein
MNERYQIDLEKYSLQKFKRSLQLREMIPSRISLKDDLDARFRILENCGIANLKELIDRLKTKQKIERFSQETGLSIQYLTLLNREAKSYLSKPIRLDKFPGVQTEYLDRLEDEGIRNTRQLFLEAQNKSGRERLSKETGIPKEVLNELVGLSDLSRIYGVGPVFARLIYDVGIRSVKEFVEYTAEDFIRIYEEQTQKKADFGVGEIQFSLELAKELEIAVDI